jgi:hypothetical protein
LVIGQSWLPAAEGLAGVEHGLMRVVQQSRQVAQLVRERLGRRICPGILLVLDVLRDVAGLLESVARISHLPGLRARYFGVAASGIEVRSCQSSLSVTGPPAVEGAGVPCSAELAPQRYRTRWRAASSSSSLAARLRTRRTCLWQCRTRR